MHDDRVKRQFTAQGLNQLWLTGITEHPTGEGKLYLCAIKDLYAGRIVGYSTAGRMQASLAVDALTRRGLLGSMGQVGSAGDDAAMESFFALLQKNVLDRRQWATREESRTAIVTWIEKTYHRRRRQDRLGQLTPVEYEMIMDPTTAHPA